MACFQGFGSESRLIWERVVNGTLGVFGGGVGFWRTMGIVGEPAGAGVALRARGSGTRGQRCPLIIAGPGPDLGWWG